VASTQLVKAFIRDEDHGVDVLQCLFNPTDYTFAKSNQWKADPLKGTNVPQASFQGGGIMSMKFQLFFDTYGADSAGDTDVRDHTDKLLGLMKIDDRLKNNDRKARKGRPPIISFHWGHYWSFKGVIKSVNLKFVLFTGDGKPVRATADVELQQVEEEGLQRPQNPTSGGPGVRASRLVRPGDTLDLIAYQEYGDPTLWRPIADANHLENPRALRAGQRLSIPSL
jgi:hypothetical protein